MPHPIRLVASILTALLVIGTVTGAADDPWARIAAIEELSNSTGEEGLASFIDEHVALELLDSVGDEELLARLRLIRERCGNAGGIEIKPLDDHHVVMAFESAAGFWNVDVRLGAEPERLITGLELGRGEEPEELPPFTWKNYAERLLAYEREGFSGAVLIVQNGIVVLDRGYGYANRELGARNSGQSLFAVGSTPIDFTKAAILLLEERGELKTTDLLSKYVEGVPADKARITLDHLLKGESGLRNFHGIPGVDADLDLAYIDRAEALARILGGELLFEPGAKSVHSHSAWAVLAAVVESVSGESYGEFLEQQLFRPAGMQRTGLYPKSAAFPDAEVAVGEGHSPLGGRATPKDWGKTSWLVMGSGGMVSTTRDLYQWTRAMRDGRLLSPAAQRKFWTGAVLAGSNDRGFLTVYSEGPDNQFVLCSNSHERSGDLPSMIASGLASLVTQAEVPAYSFGLAAEISERGVHIRVVVPGSAAAESGLVEGDLIHSIDGEPAVSDYEQLVTRAARSGTQIELVVERDGERRVVRVTPRKR